MNNRHLFLIVLEAEKSKIEAQMVRLWGELPSQFVDGTLRCPHIEGRGRASPLVSFVRALFLSWELQPPRNSRCCKRWKGLFSLGSPSSPLLPAGRKEGAIGDSGERASEGLLGQLNQRNYFPTDEAKNILMAFS